MQTCPPQAILVSNWSISKKIFSSETAWPNEPKLGRKHPWKILHKVAHLVPIPRIACGGHVCYWIGINEQSL
jgi:hypothetical protein